MNSPVIRAWLPGFAVLFAAYALWFLLVVAGKYTAVAVVLMWASPALAAFISAYRAQSKKILLGISLAVPSALLAVLLNFCVQSMGQNVDFPGSRGAVILFGTVLVASAIAAGIGSTAAAILSGKAE